MNDFTRDELQYLLEMVDSIKIVNRSVNDDELQEKLQSMIDNYCEHNFIGYAEGQATFPYCNKCCKAILNDKPI